MRGQIVSLIGCSVLWFAFSNAYGWSGPTQISNNSSSSEASVPKVASGPSGRLYVVYQQKPEWRTYYRERSATGTWSSVEVLGTNFVAGRPDVIEDNAGRVHVFYPQRNANSNYDILHSYRTPGGAWTTITASGDAGMFEDYPRVARDSAGNLHLVYAKTAVESDAGDIIYRKWNGSSWSGETVLGQTNKAYHQRPDITIDPSDQIHVAWAANGGSRNIIRYKRYSGGAWSGVSVIGQSIVDGGSNGYIAYPRIACASSNNIIACWHDDNATSNNSATVYNTSGNGGTSWGTQQVLLLGHYHGLESGNGVVYFACEQQPGGKAVLYKSWNGSTWSSTQTIVSNSYWKGWIDLTGDANGDVYIVYDDVINSSNYHVINLMTATNAATLTSVSLSSPTLIADDATPYTVTLKASHPSSPGYINDMRVMFDLNFSAPTNARGYMAWGTTTADVTKYGGTMTVQGPAGGSGYWGFDIGNWGYAYIIPVSCTTSTSGNERTVVWTFKVQSDWFYAGPLTGNFIGMFLRECDRTTGWQYSNTLFGYTFSIDHRPCIADYNSDSHVDAVDFDAFSACYNGPINPVSGNCLQLDFNGDHYVDAVDFDTFSGCYNGPANPPRC